MKQVVSRSSLSLFQFLITLAVCFIGFSNPDPSYAESDGDWPMLGQNPKRNGFNVHSSTPPTTHILWRFEASDNVVINPIVSDNIVYVVSEDCRLSAIDENNGQLVWETQLDVSHCFRSGQSPTVSNDTVFFGAGSTGQGTIYAFDRLTGEELWQYKAIYDVRSSPLYYQGKVYINVWNTGMLALDAVTGELLWIRGPGGPGGSPMIDDGKLYAPTGRLHILNPDNGELISSIDFPGTVITPAISGDILCQVVSVYNTNFDSIFVINKNSEEVLWSKHIGVYNRTRPVIFGNKVFAGENQLNAFDSSSGSLLWSLPGNVNGSPAVADGNLFVVKDSSLLGINAETGEVFWTYPLSSDASSPVIANSKIFIGIGNYVYCFYAHEHDMSVGPIEVPFPVDPEETINVSVTVNNEGLSHETNVNVEFLVNDISIDTKIIPTIDSLTSVKLNFEWTAPQNDETVTVSFRVESVAGEEASASHNNMIDQIVPVGGALRLVPLEYPTIEQALAAAFPGDRIELAAGNYNEIVDINKSHITLRGAPGAKPVFTAEHKPAITLNADSTKLENLRFEGGRTGILIQSSYNSLRNLELYGHDTAVKFYYPSENNLLTDTIISNFTNCGITYRSHSIKNVVQNCTIRDGEGSGIHLRGKENKVVNCEIFNNTGHGIYAYETFDMEIADTSIHDNGDHGIMCSSGSEKPKFNNCDVYRNYGGIYLTGTRNAVLRGIRIFDNQISFGIFAQYEHDIDTSNTINGKPILYLVNETGVTIDGSMKQVGYIGIVNCQDIRISRNIISGNYQGLLIESCENVLVTDNEFSENEFGIILLKSQANEFSNCSIHHNNTGIYLANYANSNYIKGCEIFDNKIEGVLFGNGAADNEIINTIISGNEYGIYHDSVARNLTSFCRIFDNKIGICNYHSSYAHVRHSMVYNNTEDGLYFIYPRDTFLAGNTIYSNGRYGIYSTSVLEEITNNIIWNNGTNIGGERGNITYCAIQEQTDGEGNITDDPGLWAPENNDFRLKPDSPCIDGGNHDRVGTLALDGDGDGEARPDIGAYEFPGLPDYFAIQLGNTWSYSDPDDSSSGTINTVVESDYYGFGDSAIVIEAVMDGELISRECYARVSDKILLWAIEDGRGFLVSFSNGLEIYWKSMKVGEVRTTRATTPLRNPDYPNRFLSVMMKAAVVDKQIITTMDTDYEAFKIRYDFRIWGYGIDEAQTTFQWFVPYHGLVQYGDGINNMVLNSFTVGGGILTQNSDIDNDGLIDLNEILYHNSSVQMADTDMDGCIDGIEVHADRDPTAHDSMTGDINGDCLVDQGDLIWSLKILVKQNNEIPPDMDKDVNGDGKVGLEEAIFSIQQR